MKRTRSIEAVVETLRGSNYLKAGHHKSKERSEAEFLGIDCILFTGSKKDDELDAKSNVPLIAIEYENECITPNDLKKGYHRLFYDFNKLFATTSKLRVLIGHVRLNKHFAKDKRGEELNNVKERFVKKLADYIGGTPRYFFPHRRTKHLIILGDYNVDNYVGFAITEDGKFQKLHKN